MDMKDYYQILDMPEDASPREIKTQYKRLAKLFHPDRVREKEGYSRADIDYAEEKLKEINEAHQVLSDPVQRAEYDRERASSRGVEPKSKASPAPPPPASVTCPSCGQVNNTSEIYCQRCAHQLSGSRLCPHCNRSVPVNAWYCTSCGRKLQILEQVV